MVHVALVHHLQRVRRQRSWSDTYRISAGNRPARTTKRIVSQDCSSDVAIGQNAEEPAVLLAQQEGASTSGVQVGQRLSVFYARRTGNACSMTMGARCDDQSVTKVK